MNSKITERGSFLAMATVLSAAALLQGCAVVAVGAVAGGSAVVAVDRRTTGTQIEDRSIESKVGTRAGELLGDRAHVNATSYNRTVLLTGQVPSDADRQAVGRAAAAVENVKSVVNELTLGFPAPLSNRASDSVISGKLRAKIVDAEDLAANAFRITTEQGVVYLMGMVTEAEAKRATQLATTVSGVTKVVRVFEIITPEELLKLRGKADGTR